MVYERHASNEIIGEFYSRESGVCGYRLFFSLMLKGSLFVFWIIGLYAVKFFGFFLSGKNEIYQLKEKIPG
jgi:hypothetical protein